MYMRHGPNFLYQFLSQKSVGMKDLLEFRILEVSVRSRAGESFQKGHHFFKHIDAPQSSRP